MNCNDTFQTHTVKVQSTTIFSTNPSHLAHWNWPKSTSVKQKTSTVSAWCPRNLLSTNSCSVQAHEHPKNMTSFNRMNCLLWFPTLGNGSVVPDINQQHGNVGLHRGWRWHKSRDAWTNGLEKRVMDERLVSNRRSAAAATTPQSSSRPQTSSISSSSSSILFARVEPPYVQEMHRSAYAALGEFPVSRKQQATRNNPNHNNNNNPKNPQQTTNEKERRDSTLHMQGETKGETVTQLWCCCWAINYGKKFEWRNVIACSQNRGRQKACCGRPV